MAVLEQETTSVLAALLVSTQFKAPPPACPLALIMLQTIT